MSFYINKFSELLVENISFGQSLNQTIGYLPKGAIVVAAYAEIDTTFTVGTNINFGFASNPTALFSGITTSQNALKFITLAKREVVTVSFNQASTVGSGKVAVYYFLPTLEPRE